MKLGIMSDSHDRLPYIKRAVDIFNRESVELVLHAGDYVAPFVILELSKLNCKLIGIFGNNDGDKDYLRKRFSEHGFSLYVAPYAIQLAGKRFLMVHYPNLVDSLAKSHDFDIIIYGHTHKLDIRYQNKTLIINPGETAGWLNRPSIVVLDTDTLEPKTFYLDAT